MESIAVITMRQSEYNSILYYLKTNNIDPISVKILPDDSELRQSNAIYNDNIREIRRLTKINDEIRHNTLTNK